MDVHLLVYDLSGGIARQMSTGLLGFQLDAVYHTSIELDGREYVYDGGIITIIPGSSHLGRPLQKMFLGTTRLPMHLIDEYLDSIRPMFTLEAYDLFHHNCNNFSDSFSNFLVGKGIPSDIVDMPKAVLSSPMGRQLFSHLTQGVRDGRSNGSILGLEQSASTPAQHSSSRKPSYEVRVISKEEDLTRALDEAARCCAVVFFTSATCPPCKALYPVYDELTDEFGAHVSFIKVDVSRPEATSIAKSYTISATPTFITFLKGQQEKRWTGADQAGLRGSVQLLVKKAHPTHPHEGLRIPSFAAADIKPVLFPKVPPVAKLMAKLGDDVAKKSEMQSLKVFIEKGSSQTMMPDMGRLSSLILDSVAQLPASTLFAMIDVFRCALVDQRISGFFAEEEGHKTVRRVLDSVNEQDSCPYPLRLVTLQMGSNMFSTPLFPDAVLSDGRLRGSIIRLISSSFLDESHTSVRVAASSLLFNLALADRRMRRKETTHCAVSSGSLPVDDQVELAASVVEAIDQEKESAEALRGMLLALGHLAYGMDLDGELADLLRALDAQGTVSAKRAVFPAEAGIVREVADELLGSNKGLAKP
ncbi:hypothetical protein XA68_12332 [Ophiocordyceps unilateralis]|uniref:Thioredoxin domain-containing protein n=1 Tax=Ophiocordyceps unilateralis TaxID=268505 RepID=A0A2A9PQ49_OPHUN|nr:hypothetical protein XA68_12332 [Ophiocordyceps unilateralis]